MLPEREKTVKPCKRWFTGLNERVGVTESGRGGPPRRWGTLHMCVVWVVRCVVARTIKVKENRYYVV
jgi:hypothetical protein